MIGNKKVLCVVTARAGSKGIPMKNIKPLSGKPLFMWSVLAGLQSKYVDRTVVSSNCKEVYSILSKFVNSIIDKRSCLSVDKRWEAGPVPFFIQRPDEISGDLSKNEEALIHALDFYKDRDRLEFDIVINLQPTSPVRLNLLLDRCLEEYVSGDYDSLLTATKDTPFIWQKINGEWRYPVDKNDCCERKMRQEFKEDENNSEFVYHDNGNIYIVDKEVLLKTECRIGSNPCIYETVGLENKQIDEDLDFEFIETMLKIKGIDSPVGNTDD